MTVRIFKDNRSPSVSDIIKVDGTPFDLTGSTVRYRMRAEGTATLKVDSAATVASAAAGTVRWDPASVDVDTAGAYYGWWQVTLPGGKIQDTPEFNVGIVNHSDVVGAVKTTALTTLLAAREYVLRDDTDDAEDRKLVRLINAYSSAITAYTQREWLPAVTATRQFAYDGSGFLSLQPGEARTISSITLYSDLPTTDQRVLTPGSSTVEGEFRLMPPNQTAQSTYQWIELPNAGRIGLPAWWNNPYPIGPVGRAIPAYFQVGVLADWAIGSIPDDVELACLIAVDDAFKNPTGFSSGQVGGESFVEIADATFGGEARARNLPVESRALLTPYKRGSTVVAV